MKTYCENSLCENEAVIEVPVSMDKPCDQVRALCGACEEVYTWGVQHGRACAGMQSQGGRRSCRKSRGDST